MKLNPRIIVISVVIVLIIIVILGGIIIPNKGSALPDKTDRMTVSDRGEFQNGVDWYILKDKQSGAEFLYVDGGRNGGIIQMPTSP